VAGRGAPYSRGDGCDGGDVGGDGDGADEGSSRSPSDLTPATLRRSRSPDESLIVRLPSLSVRTTSPVLWSSP